ncbi:PhzF family phenazine biosynthesis protein [Dyadobacter sp. CY356]|uniref:PhzF family phenazine biosynthesis protein n=1 Tax=Dyadobacter sp. CY356 TaxID=2906442 RepID=UPI001F1804DC|nr:PhzF family phenazine biosynthesis protein [Dyadobacter sp. CY356]MCF0058552.1 PhzF family phenazine biosynthesis protein [Dyadobacter sp. CY356]
MTFELYQIDAFTESIFGGNPACVVPLQGWLPDELLLKITRENAVAETAFFVITGDRIHLRWFTPEIEMDLCGHATLATAHALKTILNYAKDEIIFDSLSGELLVTMRENMYFLNFPSRKAQPVDLPENIKKSLNIQPKSVFKARDYLLVYDTESEIRDIRIDRNHFDQINLDPGGVIVTAKGDYSDFVSRFFTPQASILEDPVTGSAHCTLIPHWSEKLGKNEMNAEQISERSGKLFCFDQGNRVLIGGKARTYSAGHFWIE